MASANVREAALQEGYVAPIADSRVPYRGMYLSVDNRDQCEHVVEEPGARAVEGGKVGSSNIVPAKYALCLGETAKRSHLVRELL